MRGGYPAHQGGEEEGEAIPRKHLVDNKDDDEEDAAMTEAAAV